MKEYNILYIDDDNWFDKKYSNDLYATEFKITRVSFPEDIKEVIEQKQWDAVIADVFYKQFDENGNIIKEEIPRLEEIVNIIRSYNSKVPIVALSKQGAAENEAIKIQGEIFDIWSKEGGYPEFIRYRLRHLIDVVQTFRSEEPLINETIRLCKNEKDIWAEQNIAKFCINYKDFSGVGKLLQEIIALFRELSLKSGLKPSFIDTALPFAKRTEAIDLSRSENSWGHLRHSLSVFLMGYNIINNTLTNNYIDKILLKVQLESKDQLNKAWFIAAAFHDSLIFIEHLPKMAESLSNLLYKSFFADVSCFAKTTSSQTNREQQINLKSLRNCTVIPSHKNFIQISALLERIGQNDTFKIIEAVMNRTPDHGILAAMSLIDNSIIDSDFPQIILDLSAAAMLFHNIIDGIECQIDNDCYFLISMLSIIDHFQAWGRENGYEGIAAFSCFSQNILRTFSITKNAESIITIKMVIDFMLHAYLSPKDQIIITAERELKKILSTHIEKLTRVGLKTAGKKLRWKEFVIDLLIKIQGRTIDYQ